MAGNGRIAIAFGFIGLMLAALVWLLLTDGDSEPEAGPTTTSTSTSTSTTTVEVTTTTVADTTTTSLDTDARVAEVARILEDLELARLVAIFNEDTPALAGIVATQRNFDLAVEAMDNLDFIADPSVVGIEITVLDVLLDRTDCLVIYHEFNGEKALGAGAVEEGVRILWPRSASDPRYRLARLWSSPADLWQDDCDLMDRTEIP